MSAWYSPVSRPQKINDEPVAIRIKSGKRSGVIIHVPPTETIDKPRNILNDRLNRHLSQLEESWERSYKFEQIRDLLIKIITDEQKPLIEEITALKNKNFSLKPILHKKESNIPPEISDLIILPSEAEIDISDFEFKEEKKEEEKKEEEKKEEEKKEEEKKEEEKKEEEKKEEEKKEEEKEIEISEEKDSESSQNQKKINRIKRRN